MNNEAKKTEYPYAKSRIYLSVILAALSLIFAIELLATPAFILRYLALTIIIATVIFVLKRRYFYTKTTEMHEKDANIDSRSGTSWILLILLFAVIITILVSPLFLANFLDPYTWFTLIVSLPSGISISEILIYTYGRYR